MAAKTTENRNNLKELKLGVPEGQAFDIMYATFILKLYTNAT